MLQSHSVNADTEKAQYFSLILNLECLGLIPFFLLNLMQIREQKNSQCSILAVGTLLICSERIKNFSQVFLS
jgi:hypothetical protein